MKKATAGALIFLLFILSCSGPASTVQQSTIRVSVIGTSQNPLALAWTVHGHTGSQSTALNYSSVAPWTVSYGDIAFGTYGEVSISLANTHTNQVKLTGTNAVIAPGGWVGSEKTLDLDSGVPNLKDIAVGDYLEDNSARLLPIIDVQNTTVPHRITVKDNNNNFDPGSWRILTSNLAYFTVWIERDGIVLGPPKTYGSLIGDVSFSYGSLAW